ncbi:MAG: helix-turn-helix domain-containing protein [Acidimicrobiales bacterium]|nr:helix-turn-helix domain-containing protein [Acidimicrobiales bacterium]
MWSAFQECSLCPKLTQVAVSAGTLRNEIKRGNLRARRIGRCVRILDEDLAAWLRADQPPPNTRTMT